MNKEIRLSLSIFTLIVLFTAFTTNAHAACSNPTGAEGDLGYNTNWRVVQYCDGTNWQAAMKAWAGSTGDCTSPDRPEGAIIYNEDDNVPQVCIGEWRALGPINAGAGTGGCTTPTKAEGTIIYNDDDNMMQYCDGSQYVRLLGPAPENCPNVGETCADGSIYAGISPDGSERMFVPRCDFGMSFDGVLCQGARINQAWNNGENDWTFWGGSSFIDGDGNTEFLLQFDSDADTAGVQTHNAAQACSDLVDHGKGDWYLPARDELDVIYENLVDATPNDDVASPLHDGFVTNGSFYWSSSENANSNAWRQRFSDGFQNLNNKNGTSAVRCARR